MNQTKHKTLIMPMQVPSMQTAALCPRHADTGVSLNLGKGPADA